MDIGVRYPSARLGVQPPPNNALPNRLIRPLIHSPSIRRATAEGSPCGKQVTRRLQPPAYAFWLGYAAMAWR